MWRPKGWRNPFALAAIGVKDRNGKPISHHNAFEAGADAMLEALLKDGLKLNLGDIPKCKGTIILQNLRGRRLK